MVSKTNYKQIYNTLYNQGYGESHQVSHAIRYLLADEVLKLRPTSAFDIGAATGSTVQFLRLHNIDATGIEPSSSAVKTAIQNSIPLIEGVAHSLPYVDNRFDIVMSSDVFEHIHPDDVDASVSEAVRVARLYVAMRISTRRDGSKWKSLAANQLPPEAKGHLHMTVKSLDWWIEKFQQFAPDSQIVYSEPEQFILKLGEH